MCGIAGIVDKRGALGPDRLRSIALDMAGTIAHRGPDDEGVWVSPDGTTALSHRRLSIIDTSPAGHQPMLTAEGSALVFNGEIYNFLDLRGGLERDGVRFQSHSDTEVLLELVDREGVDALDRLDGMFAFAFHRKADASLFIARDIFGEKPLYYLDNDDVFAFASELSALMLVPGFDARIDADTIARFLMFQYLPAPASIYRSVCKLPPGHSLLRTADGQIRVERHFRFETSDEEVSSRPIADLADELEALLTKSVRQRMISDVPIGAFLSGGVDSSVVAALAMRLADAPVKTYTIGFSGFPESEHTDAAEVAKMLGTSHNVRMLDPDALAIGADIGARLDEPNADSSCLPTFLLSRFAREEVTVALSGDGGDEMFGGYGRYFATVDEGRAKDEAGGMDWWTPGIAYWSSRILVYPPEEIVRLFGALPESVEAEILGLRSGLDADGRALINCLREADASHYMPGAVLAKVDRMSMQVSLEVRAPLIGRDVATFASGLAADACYRDGHGKRVLKEVAYRYLPKEWIDRPKRGFGLPMTLWGAEKLLPTLRDLLVSDDAQLTRWIDRDHLLGYLGHLERDFNAYRAWALYVLEIWLRTHPAEVGFPVHPERGGGPVVPSPRAGGWRGLARRTARRVFG